MAGQVFKLQALKTFDASKYSSSVRAMFDAAHSGSHVVLKYGGVDDVKISCTATVRGAWGWQVAKKQHWLGHQHSAPPFPKVLACLVWHDLGVCGRGGWTPGWTHKVAAWGESGTSR